MLPHKMIQVHIPGLQTCTLEKSDADFYLKIKADQLGLFRIFRFGYSLIASFKQFLFGRKATTLFNLKRIVLVVYFFA